ncbi:MAG: hypothetical protein ABJH45_22345 [Paracoccaceae bacterium]
MRLKKALIQSFLSRSRKGGEYLLRFCALISLQFFSTGGVREFPFFTPKSARKTGAIIGLAQSNFDVDIHVSQSQNLNRSGRIATMQRVTKSMTKGRIFLIFCL